MADAPGANADVDIFMEALKKNFGLCQVVRRASFTAAKATALADAFIRSIESNNNVTPNMLQLPSCRNLESNHWDIVLRAASSLDSVYYWNLYGCDFDEKSQGVLLKWVEKTPQLVSLDIAEHPRMTLQTIERLCSIYIGRPKCSELILGDQMPYPISDEAFQMLAEIKARSPDARFGLGPQGKFIQAMVSSTSLNSSSARSSVATMQKQIFDLYSERHLEEADSILQTLKEVSTKEQSRLFSLLPAFLDKCSLIGGMHWLSTLPADFNDNACQKIPEWLTEEPVEDQVRFLLAKSAYIQEVFVSLITEVVRDVEEIMSSSDLKVSLRKHLDSDVVHMQAWHFSGDESISNAMGLFIQHGISSGSPYFQHETNKDCLLFRGPRDDEWSIGNSGLGSGIRRLQLPDRGEKRLHPVPDDQGKWLVLNDNSRNINVTVKEMKADVNLHESLATFNKLRAEGNNFVRMLAVHPQTVQMHIGPPKDFARALDKARAKKTKGASSLKDLNRATLVFDSPAVLFLAYKLLETKVQKRNGSLSRLSNFFFQQGRLTTKMAAPPCIHMNVKLDGHICEVMLTFADIFKAKHTIHKFYDVSRVDSLSEVLKPVF